MIFVNQGLVLAGFLDTQNQLFQNLLKEGDVFVFPTGLLHFYFNMGFEPAIIFSVLNSQNPGLVSISGRRFDPKDNVEMVRKLLKRLILNNSHFPLKHQNDAIFLLSLLVAYCIFSYILFVLDC